MSSCKGSMTAAASCFTRRDHSSGANVTMTHRVHNRTVGTIISQPILRVLFVPCLANCADFPTTASCSSFAKTLKHHVPQFRKLRTTNVLDKPLRMPSSCRFAFGILIGASFISSLRGSYHEGRI